MKVLPKHKEIFKKVIEDYNFGPLHPYICPQITIAAGDNHKLRKECRAIFHHYFCDPDHSNVFWLQVQDNLTTEGMFTCRLIALYTLIYADL